MRDISPACTIMPSANATDPAELRLTPTEWAILDILVRHRGALVTQRRLLTAVWGPNFRTQTNYLRVYLAQLRQKLEAAGERRLIQTRRGVGYELRDEP